VKPVGVRSARDTAVAEARLVALQIKLKRSHGEQRPPAPGPDRVHQAEEG
jgi:hypothetical protein